MHLICESLHIEIEGNPVLSFAITPLACYHPRNSAKPPLIPFAGSCHQSSALWWLRALLLYDWKMIAQRSSSRRVVKNSGGTCTRTSAPLVERLSIPLYVRLEKAMSTGELAQSVWFFFSLSFCRF